MVVVAHTLWLGSAAEQPSALHLSEFEIEIRRVCSNNVLLAASDCDCQFPVEHNSSLGDAGRHQHLCVERSSANGADNDNSTARLLRPL